MKITLEVSGGFAALPALNAPRSIDTATMASDRASEIESIVRSTGFFELPLRLDTTRRGAADHFIYTITIEDGGQVHTVELTDPVTDDRVMRLIDAVRTSPGST